MFFNSTQLTSHCIIPKGTNHKAPTTPSLAIKESAFYY